MHFAPPPVLSAPAPIVAMAAASTPARTTADTATPVVETAATKPGAGAELIVPGDAPRSISAAAQSLTDAVRDLFWGEPKATLPTAGPIDLERYSGKWYELARLSVRFQDPRTVSTAEYALLPNGKIEVKNTAWLGDEVDSKIVGSATVAEGAQNDRLRVRFGGFLRFIPVPKEGNYWVIDKTDDYSMALVGTPDRKFLWLLSRDEQAWGTPTSDKMVAKAKELGFDTDELLVADWDKRVIRER
jgi:apolipoprotein D and lipocalin family protein